MKSKHYVWLMPVTALAVSMVVVTSSMAATVAHPERPLVTTTVTTTTATTTIGYTLKIADGVIGMYRENSEKPYRTLDMPVSLLSDYDRELLEKGITAETESEIRALVEDLTS